MTTAQYNATLASLNASMESEVGVQIDANKSAVVGLFPGVWAWLVRTVLWAGLLKIGRVIGEALVGVVLNRLGQMTLADVAGLLEMYLRSKGLPPQDRSGFTVVGKTYVRPDFHAVDDDGT